MTLSEPQRQQLVELLKQIDTAKSKKQRLEIRAKIKAMLVAAMFLIIVSCEKEITTPPGEKPYCVTCQDEKVKYDTCGTLDECNQWAKKYNSLTCYYKQKP
jgi:hypothetical protein